MTKPLTREEIESARVGGQRSMDRVLALLDRAEVAERGCASLRLELEAARAERDLAAAERDEFMRQRDRAAEALMAAEREADRLRHGAPVEGDFVCPNELSLREARGQVAALEAELARVRAETWREACLHIGNLVEQMTDQQRTAARRLLTVKVNDTRRDELRALGTWIRAHATLSPPEPAAVDGAKGPTSPGFGDRLTEVVRGATERAAERGATRCPTCDSPRPTSHPAASAGGEVQPCADPWHASTEDGRRMLARVPMSLRGATERACANCGESPCVQLNDCGGTGRAR